MHAKAVGSVSFFIVKSFFVRSRRATVLHLTQCARREKNRKNKNNRVPVFCIGIKIIKKYVIGRLCDICDKKKNLFFVKGKKKRKKSSSITF